MVNLNLQRKDILESMKQEFQRAMSTTITESNHTKQRIMDKCNAQMLMAQQHTRQSIQICLHQNVIKNRVHVFLTMARLYRELRHTFIKLQEKAVIELEVEVERCRLDVMNLRDDFESATADLISKENTDFNY
jgi:hypothetical protein